MRDRQGGGENPEIGEGEDKNVKTEYEKRSEKSLKE